MKNRLLFAFLTLGVTVSSCNKIDFYNVDNAVDAGIKAHEDSYTSWIVVQNEDGTAKHQVTLNYPQSEQVVLPPMLVSGIVLKDVIRSEEKIDSTFIDDITIYTNRVSYHFKFADFVIPVSYTEEYALWRDADGTRQCRMPKVKVENISTEMSITSLPYEKIDGHLYGTKLLVLEVIAERYIYSATEVKLFSATSISLDDTYNEQIHEIFI